MPLGAATLSPLSAQRLDGPAAVPNTVDEGRSGGMASVTHALDCVLDASSRAYHTFRGLAFSPGERGA